MAFVPLYFSVTELSPKNLGTVESEGMFNVLGEYLNNDICLTDV